MKQRGPQYRHPVLSNCSFVSWSSVVVSVRLYMMPGIALDHGWSRDIQNTPWVVFAVALWNQEFLPIVLCRLFELGKCEETTAMMPITRCMLIGPHLDKCILSQQLDMPTTMGCVTVSRNIEMKSEAVERFRMSVKPHVVAMCSYSDQSGLLSLSSSGSDGRSHCALQVGHQYTRLTGEDLCLCGQSCFCNHLHSNALGESPMWHDGLDCCC